MTNPNNSRADRIRNNPLTIAFEIVGRRFVILSTLTPCALWKPGDVCQEHGCDEPSTVRCGDGNPYGFGYYCPPHGRERFNKYASPTWAGH